MQRLKHQLGSNIQQSSVSHSNPDTLPSTYEDIDNENPAIYSFPDKASINPSSNTDMYACIPVVENSLQQTTALSDTTDMVPTNYEVPYTQGPEGSTYAKPSFGNSSGSFSNNNSDYQDPLEQGGDAPSSAGEDMLYHSVGPKVRQKEAGERSNKTGYPIAPPPYVPPINDAEQEHLTIFWMMLSMKIQHYQSSEYDNISAYMTILIKLFFIYFNFIFAKQKGMFESTGNCVPTEVSMIEKRKFEYDKKV